MSATRICEGESATEIHTMTSATRIHEDDVNDQNLEIEHDVIDQNSRGRVRGLKFAKVMSATRCHEYNVINTPARFLWNKCFTKWHAMSVTDFGIRRQGTSAKCFSRIMS